MRLFVRTLVSVLLLSSVPALAGKPPASAPTKSVPQGPRPAPQLESLAWLLGTWSCQGSVSLEGKGPMTAEGTYTLEKDLDGFWIAGRFESAPSKANPVPHVMKDFWTYSEAKRSFIRVDLDNMGDFARTTSRGFEKGKLEWSGTITMGPREVPFKETFTQVSETEMKLEGSAPGPNGKPALSVAYTCTKK